MICYEMIRKNSLLNIPLVDKHLLTTCYVLHSKLTQRQGTDGKIKKKKKKGRGIEQANTSTQRNRDRRWEGHNLGSRMGNFGGDQRWTLRRGEKETELKNQRGEEASRE